MLARFQLRLLITAIVLPIVLFCMGVAETGRCCRALIGPSTISYDDACSKGLAGFGYVRITGVHPNVDKSTVIVRKSDTGSPLAEKSWVGAYVPIEPPETDGQAAPAPDPGFVPGQYALLAWLPNARSDDDVLELEEHDNIVGFVDSTFADVDPARQNLVKYVNRARADHCWIVKVRRPSWFRGLGLTLASLVIPGLYILYRWHKSR